MNILNAKNIFLRSKTIHLMSQINGNTINCFFKFTDAVSGGHCGYSLRPSYILTTLLIQYILTTLLIQYILTTLLIQYILTTLLIQYILATPLIAYIKIPCLYLIETGPN
jgi:hypothetical protein